MIFIRTEMILFVYIVSKKSGKILCKKILKLDLILLRIEMIYFSCALLIFFKKWNSNIKKSLTIGRLKIFAFKNKKWLKLGGKRTVNRRVCFGPILIANQMVSLIIVLNDIKVHNIRYPSISWAHLANHWVSIGVGTGVLKP